MIIHEYEAPWTIYGMHWSLKPETKFRLALGSFIEEYNNKVQIVSLDISNNTSSGRGFTTRCQFEHPYPTTKISWIPDTIGTRPDLLATSGDYLRIWKINPTHDPNKDTVEQLALLNDSLLVNQEYCAPLTSFDWNENDPNILGTSSIDTTCTIWNIETNKPIGNTKPNGTVQTKLIAHDKEVYDIAFSSGGNGKETFASVGNDGSVRLFDLRSLEHSTIIYESDFCTVAPSYANSHSHNANSAHSHSHNKGASNQGVGVGVDQMNLSNPHNSKIEKFRRPLIRLAWNKQDPNYIATMPLDSTEIVILDIRYPCTPLTKLNDHRACVNDLAWAPHSSCHICTAGDDKQALIWDISQQNHQSQKMDRDEPILAYSARGEINKVHWSSRHYDWIAVCFDKTLEILRV